MSRIGERRHACTLEATPEPPPLCYQTAAMKSSLLPGRIFTPHQPTHNLHLSFLFFFLFLSLLVGRACSVAPRGSDYSSDHRASTCRSLQSGEGGFLLCCRASQPAMAMAQPGVYSPFLQRGLTFCDRLSLSGTLAIFPGNKRDPANPPSVPCAEKRAR